MEKYERESAFRDELRALLKKHNAEIDCLDDHIEVYMDSEYDSDGNIVKPFCIFSLGKVFKGY